MKRREFILAAAVASLYSPITIGKSTQSLKRHFYFDIIGAKKEIISFPQNHFLTSCLNKEASSILQMGYIQNPHLYFCANSLNEHILFFSYNLTVSDIGCIDTQYIVLKKCGINSYQKIACFSTDFIEAIDLLNSKLTHKFDTQSLKKFLTPNSRDSNKPDQIFKADLGTVGFRVSLGNNYKKFKLWFETPLENIAFSTTKDIQSIIT